jgi:hypothetical protein
MGEPDEEALKAVFDSFDDDGSGDAGRLFPPPFLLPSRPAARQRVCQVWSRGHMRVTARPVQVRYRRVSWPPWLRVLA